MVVTLLVGFVREGRQKHDLSDARSVAIACEEFATDRKAYPGQDRLGPVSGIEKAVTPDYVSTLPSVDHWGHPALYQSFGNATVEAPDLPPLYGGKDYVVIFTGSDGTLDAETLALLKPGPTGEPRLFGLAEPIRTHCFESDIVFTRGELKRLPEGKQRKCGSGRG